MADEAHLKLLKQGVGAWNEWRAKNPDLIPDLSGAKLRGLDLTSVNLIGARLGGTELDGADLNDADLNHADLTYATLNGAILKAAYLAHADLTGARLRHANLIAADATSANLTRSDLSDADLSRACFSGAILIAANLSNAVIDGSNLSEVNLHEANLSRADLTHANLSHANLRKAVFAYADLRDANFNDAELGWTAFVDNDLRAVKGLDKAVHHGPSSIGIDTIYQSNGKIPAAFLRGAGIPDNFIIYIESLTEQAFRFYSCFISYSNADKEFADRLHSDLQSKGIRSWFAPADLKIGENIRRGIDESIRLYDKLLLILSKDSITSQWVEQEVETALAKERNQGRITLFPIRVDDTVMSVKSGWPSLIKNTRNIGDFREWKNYESYRKAFDRLVRDLKESETGGGDAR